MVDTFFFPHLPPLRITKRIDKATRWALLGITDELTSTSVTHMLNNSLFLAVILVRANEGDTKHGHKNQRLRLNLCVVTEACPEQGGL